MGTDIHGFIQEKRNGEWKNSLISAFEGRDYMVFAILANVRNGYTFGNNPIVPIQMNRGLPTDLDVIQPPGVGDSYSYSLEYDGMWLGEHSFGYALLTELLNYNWKQTLPEGGVLSIEQYRAWDKVSEPSSYSSEAFGVDLLSQEEAEALVPTEDQEHVYVYCSWEQPLSQACPYFTEWINSLKDYAIREDIHFNDIRFVFGFDS